MMISAFFFVACGSGDISSKDGEWTGIQVGSRGVSNWAFIFHDGQVTALEEMLQGSTVKYYGTYLLRGHNYPN